MTKQELQNELLQYDDRAEIILCITTHRGDVIYKPAQCVFIDNSADTNVIELLENIERLYKVENMC